MKYRLTTTLARLHEKQACADGYRKLRKHLGCAWPDDAPINLLTILASNGVADMLWCLCATVEDSRVPRLLIAADIAESVLPIWAARYPDDKRPAAAIQAARDLAHGCITTATADAAYAAADAADAAAAAADAAYAADAAAAAASAAAYAYAASAAAADAAYAAAYADADAKERGKQAVIIRKWLEA